MVVNGQINPSGNDDWSLIVDLSRDKLANQTQIPRLELEVSLNSKFIAVEVLTSNAKPTWVAGGYLAQVYELEQFDLTPPQYFVSINQVNLLELSQIANTQFSLVYDPPKYFNDVRIKIWQYRGIETDLLLADIASALNNIPITATVDLSEVNQKLDTLIAAVGDGVQCQSIELFELSTKVDLILNYFNIPQPVKPVTVTTANLNKLRLLRII